MLKRTPLAVSAKVLGYSSSNSSSDKVFHHPCVVAGDHQVVVDAHRSESVSLKCVCLREWCANAICFSHRLVAKKRPMFMELWQWRFRKKREKQGFEHDTDVMVRVPCAMGLVQPTSQHF